MALENFKDIENIIIEVRYGDELKQSGTFSPDKTKLTLNNITNSYHFH
jgi:hypothetical protein